MSTIKKTNPKLWSGRISGQKLYLHEKVQCLDTTDEALATSPKSIAILGYATDEGVQRNQGRIGAAKGPDAIRTQLAKMPNHLHVDTQLHDIGSIQCLDGNMEAAQNLLAKKVSELLKKEAFPILLGGGHDIAYGHFNGIKNHVQKGKSIGIINFDAHFDLRSNNDKNTSGTPFYQIAQDAKAEDFDFRYLCIGIRPDANDRILYETAQQLEVSFIENSNFTIENTVPIVRKVLDFLDAVDYVYATIDLDGFSSAFAPGVSAPSPMGFTPDMVLKTLEVIIKSKKLISLDIAEMNPEYDIDNHTARLAASLVHFVAHKVL